MKIVILLLTLVVISLGGINQVQAESLEKHIVLDKASYFGRSDVNLGDNLTIIIYNNTATGSFILNNEILSFSDIELISSDSKFKIKDLQSRFVIFGNNTNDLTYLNVIFMENREKSKFLMIETDRKEISPLHELRKSQVVQFDDVKNNFNVETDPIYLSYLEYKTNKNIPVANYSNNIIEDAKVEIVDNFYLSVDVPKKFTNDHSNQLEAYVYNKGIKLSDISITFELVKNGIVEATTTETTIDEVGARGVWKLNELLTPAGCYEFVVTAVVNGEELKQTEKIQVVREVGMSHETIEELHTCVNTT